MRAWSFFEGKKIEEGDMFMKKFLLCLFIAMFMVVPMSFAKTVISEKDLQEVTAQEGVTINFDCFTVGAISIAVQSWGDSDGCATCGGFTSTGWVGASVDMSSNFVSMTGNMTIDVGSSGTKTALIIGLPNLNLAGSITQVVKLSTSPTLGSAGVLGTSFMSGLSVTPTGQLIIYAH
ncbi:MAG: hypothetical protein JW976_01320 [Syntrophaceae bacterium]|nr:hypothetical protein [Syntrophaceae bacterium]